MKDGKSYIDQDKCIKCGKCKAACPYDAISHNIRPCEQACGVKAIGSDEQGRASILEDKLRFLWYVYGKLSIRCDF